jgi:hypothetical protein
MAGVVPVGHDFTGELAKQQREIILERAPPMPRGFTTELAAARLASGIILSEA